LQFIHFCFPAQQIFLPVFVSKIRLVLGEASLSRDLNWSETIAEAFFTLLYGRSSLCIIKNEKDTTFHVKNPMKSLRSASLHRKSSQAPRTWLGPGHATAPEKRPSGSKLHLFVSDMEEAESESTEPGIYNMSLHLSH
jgi:hypothetical protein